MNINIFKTKEEMGREAAERGAALIREAIEARGRCAIILATGASQFEMLSALLEQDVEWPKVTAFHLDEYVGLDDKHPASFRRYLRERFVERLSQPMGSFNWVNGEGDAAQECSRLAQLINKVDIDVAFVGIGENGHLAFNDPPADFQIQEPYLVVDLDEACRRQQLGEGWFNTLNEVPARAISMSVQQILKSKAIICTVPDQRKARAVRDSVNGPVTPNVPASILQTHPACWLFLDEPAASELNRP